MLACALPLGGLFHGLSAQTAGGPAERLRVGAAAGWGQVLGVGEFGKEAVRSHGLRTYSVQAGWQALPTDTNRYDRAFGFPTFEGGLLLADYGDVRLQSPLSGADYASGMGRMVAAYAGFRRDVVRTGRFAFGYSLENGVGVSTRPYNRIDNVDNQLIGSRFSVYLKMGFHASFRINRHWEAGAGFAFRHFSNGGLDRPNKGANSMEGNVRLAYSVAPQPPPAPAPLPKEKFPKRLYADVSAAWVMKTLLDEWLYDYLVLQPGDPAYRTGHYRIHSALDVSAALMYRYSRKYASGLGLEYTYAPYARDIARFDELCDRPDYGPHKCHVAGLSLRHEVFYKRVSLHMSLGAYLYRKMGFLAHTDEKPYYETVGVRYYLPLAGDRFYVGYNVKAHLLKADCMQLRLGVRLGKPAAGR